MAFGVDPTGFVAKTVADITSDMQAAMRRVFGPAVNLDPRSRIGQLVGVFSDALSSVWELAEVVAAGLDPASSSGVLLKNLAALTGTLPKAATKSTVLLVVTGTPDTYLSIGRRVQVMGSSSIFETTTGVWLLAAPAWTVSIYASGAVVASAGALWVATLPIGGLSMVAPTGTGPTFVDPTGLTWLRLSEELGAVVVSAQAVETGPVQGYSGTITVIGTPVSGWATVVNPFDAAPGTNAETDPELRARRQQEIAGIGSSPLPALHAKLLKVPGVTSVTVFENTTDSTADGIPPHAVECLVEGGTNADIIAAIYAAKAGGIQAAGSSFGSVTDSAGNPHTIAYTRPTSVPIYAAVALTKNPAAYPLDGDARVAKAIADAGNLRGLGVDVVASRVGGDVFAGVPGIIDVTSVLIGTAPGPTLSATVAISGRARASFDTSRISVSSTSGAP
jgi:uncharacterized phage protein gp47/JayE